MISGQIETQSGYMVTCIVVQKMNNNTSLFTFTNQNQNKQMREQTNKEQKGKFLYAYFTTDSLSAVTLCACSILSLESWLMVQDANMFQQKSKKVKYIADTIKKPNLFEATTTSDPKRKK